MKQMIKNHEAIESLEDFIYYDKSSGKIKLKKQIDGVGGTQLYKHVISLFNDPENEGTLVVYSKKSTAYTTVQSIFEDYIVVYFCAEDTEYYDLVSGHMYSEDEQFTQLVYVSTNTQNIATYTLYDTTELTDSITPL